MANPDTVLVVEDDPEISELVSAYVQIAGFDPAQAPDGNTALRRAREFLPCLIVLDLMLPDITGFDVCRQLRSEEKTARIPILMLSALNRDEDRLRGKECGATAYLTKPFDPDTLMRMIQQTATHPN